MKSNQTFSLDEPSRNAGRNHVAVDLTVPDAESTTQWAAVSTRLLLTKVPVQPLSRRPTAEYGLPASGVSRLSGPKTFWPSLGRDDLPQAANATTASAARPKTLRWSTRISS